MRPQSFLLYYCIATGFRAWLLGWWAHSWPGSFFGGATPSHEKEVESKKEQEKERQRRGEGREGGKLLFRRRRRHASGVRGVVLRYQVQIWPEHARNRLEAGIENRPKQRRFGLVFRAKTGGLERWQMGLEYASIRFWRNGKSFLSLFLTLSVGKPDTRP